MWGFIKDLAGSVWDGLTGTLSSLWNLVTWVIHRVIGLLELIWSLLGFKPAKKLRVKVIILLDAHGQPVASRADVDAVVTLAKEVFREQANVRIVSPSGSEGLIASVHPRPAPDYVMNPKCDAGGYAQSFSRPGRWFRRHSARTPAGAILGYGAPATIFVVNDVLDKSGCFLGVTTSYGYIDGGALTGSEPQLLTFAHELGHACDLLHRERTLMAPSSDTRSRRLTHGQRAAMRSSPRVTYL